MGRCTMGYRPTLCLPEASPERFSGGLKSLGIGIRVALRQLLGFALDERTLPCLIEREDQDGGQESSQHASPEPASTFRNQGFHPRHQQQSLSIQPSHTKKPSRAMINSSTPHPNPVANSRDLPEAERLCRVLRRPSVASPVAKVQVGRSSDSTMCWTEGSSELRATAQVGDRCAGILRRING